MAKKCFNTSPVSIDVVDRETRIVLCHCNYSPLVSGDWENARDLSVKFVRDYCERHNREVTSFQFFDHYHGACWSLNS